MLDARKSDLIAVIRPPSNDWGLLLRMAWDAGAAVLPIDHRLPPAEVERLLEAARPALVVDEAGDAVRRSGDAPVPDGTGLVVATSGSTGEPKLAELPHAAVGAAVAASIARLGATAEDPWLCCLPLAHMGGLLVLLRAETLGAPLRVHERFDVDAFMAEKDTRFTSVVPTMLRRLEARGAALTQYRAMLVGGAPLTTDSAAPIVRTYGMTESCGGVIYDGVPLDGVRMRVADDGEIQLAGTTLMRGYRFSDEQPFTADGWLRTNDAGEIDDGVLRVLGRIDDAIITGGEKVWPAEVEAVLRAHSRVADVAVTGRADAEWGAIVVAHVVPSATAPALEDLRAFAGERLARHKLPRVLELVNEIPRTPSGKIARRAL